MNIILNMNKLNDINIEVYYDGTNIENNCGDEIKGFTTNISFLKQSRIENYEEFILNSLKYNKGRPISFQLYDELDDDIRRMALRISKYDPFSIFVKVPVMKTNGELNNKIIKELHNEGVQINVTAIFTKEQIDSVKDCFNENTNVIISIFAGRINDSGIDSTEIVQYASNTFSNYSNIKILWAACRTVYNMFEASNQGADIVTVPESVLSRSGRIGDNLYDASIKTIQQFRQDGIDGNIGFKVV